MNTFAEMLSGPFVLVLRDSCRFSGCLKAPCFCFSSLSRFTWVSIHRSERVCVNRCAFVEVRACVHVCGGEGFSSALQAALVNWFGQALGPGGAVSAPLSLSCCPRAGDGLMAPAGSGDIRKG